MRRVDRIVLPPPSIAGLDDKVTAVTIQAGTIEDFLVIPTHLVVMRHKPVFVLTKIGTTRL